jgi:hypothetical protein
MMIIRKEIVSTPSSEAQSERFSLDSFLSALCGSHSSSLVLASFFYSHIAPGPCCYADFFYLFGLFFFYSTFSVHNNTKACSIGTHNRGAENSPAIAIHG